jgi:hypothetical protein
MLGGYRRETRRPGDQERVDNTLTISVDSFEASRLQSSRSTLDYVSVRDQCSTVYGYTHEPRGPRQNQARQAR